ncbi:RMD1 family protein [Patescibacteria group bacterium]
MKKHELVARYVKTPLNLAKISQIKAKIPLVEQERNLLVFKPDEERFVCVYGYGVMAFFGFEDDAQIAEFTDMVTDADGGEPAEIDKEIDIEPDRHEIIIDPTLPEAVEFDFVRIQDLELDKLLLICDVAAQSIMVDYLDARVETILVQFEQIHSKLARTGRLFVRTRKIMKMIGRNSTIINFVVGKLSFLDKPDITWEEKEYEVLYTKLRKEFELDDRSRALKFRLEFVKDSSELVLDMLSTRRSEFLELTIIILIAVELLYFVFLP